MASDSSELYFLLSRIGLGNSALEKKLFERVEGELRRLAKGMLNKSPSDPLLQPTALSPKQGKCVPTMR